MVAIVKWSILLALACVHLGLSHAVSVPVSPVLSDGHGSSLASAAVETKGVYTEGGAVVNVTSSAVPETVHASVKKRILSEASLPAPVVEDRPSLPVVPKAQTEASTNATVATTSKVVPLVTMDKPQSAGNITSTSTSSSSSSSTTTTRQPPISVANTKSTSGVSVGQEMKPIIESSKRNETSIEPNSPKSAAKPASPTTSSTSKATTTTSTTTSTTKTTTTTTTTPKPKKPTITVSLDDDPNIVHVPSIKSVPDRTPAAPHHGPVIHNNLDVEEPIAQLSRENLYDDENARKRNSRRDLVVPVVSLIFTLPMLLGLATVVVRKFRDYWHTRHYRRMDFLVDGIYND